MQIIYDLAQWTQLKTIQGLRWNDNISGVAW
jgi:hypothetical protein